MEAEILEQLTHLAVPGADAAFVTGLNPRAITSIRELRHWYTTVVGPILIYSTGNLTGVVDPLYEFTVDLANQDHSAYVIGLIGVMHAVNHNIGSCLMVIGPQIVCAQLGSVQLPVGIDWISSPVELFRQYTLPDDTIGGDIAVMEDRVLICEADDRGLVTWLSQGNATATSKFASTVFNLFPYMRNWLRNRTMTLPLVPALAAIGAAGAAGAPLTKVALDLQFRSATAIFLLGQSYSNPLTASNQIHKRMSAAAADMGQGECTPAELQRVYQDTGFAITDRTRLMDELLGQLLARNRAGQFEILVAKANLWHITDILADGQATPWGGALLAQARLVFENTHEKTLQMALRIEPLISDLLEAMEGNWLIERNRIAAVRQEVADAPYTGLVAVIPNNRQISQWSRIACIGAKHHEACLSSQADKVAFQMYNVNGIRDHIGSTADVITCDAIVDTIPEESVVGLTRVVRAVPLERGRRLMMQKTEETRGYVLRYMIEQDVVCEWRTYFSAELARVEVARVRAQADPLARRAIVDRFQRLSGEATRDPIPAEALRKRGILDAMESAIILQLDGDDPIGQGVAPPPDDIVNAAYYT
jgi:hypothetical protein